MLRASSRIGEGELNPSQDRPERRGEVEGGADGPVVGVHQVEQREEGLDGPGRRRIDARVGGVERRVVVGLAVTHRPSIRPVVGAGRSWYLQTSSPYQR
jgi:hypothetical protein